MEEKWFERFMGTPDTETARGLIAHYSLPSRWEDLVDIKRDKLINITGENVSAFDGAKEGLAGLAGFPISIATSSSRDIAESLLDAAGLKNFFKVIITSDDVLKTKPDPECYLEACRRIGLDPSVCLAVEDSPAGRCFFMV
jgi:HAD superfamily hydrolase (TIGR01509 family)